MAPQDNSQSNHEAHERKREEKLLDKSLEDTFPASDPSSVTRAPKEKRETKHPPAEGAEQQTPSKRSGR